MPDDPIAAAETEAARPTADVSVVIPAYGECPHLPEVLAALGRQTVRPREILVIHTGDHDPTAALAGRDPLLTVIHQDQRLYAGAARNIGIDRAAGAWIAFLDADVIPVDHWLAALLEAANAAPDRFVVGSVGYARTGGYWGLSLWAIEFSSVHPYMPDREMQGGGGGNMMVRAASARAVGAYPPGQAAGEDVAFADRLRTSGLVNWFCAAARVDHVNRAGLRHFSGHLYWLGRGRGQILLHDGTPNRMHGANRLPSILLWAGRFWLVGYRALRWAGGRRWLIAVLMPGILIGQVIWNVGYVNGKGVINRKPAAEPMDD